MNLSRSLATRLRAILLESKHQSDGLEFSESLVNQLVNPKLRKEPRNKLQAPAFFLDSLSQDAWIDPGSHPRIEAAVKDLEQNFERIAFEIRGISQSRSKFPSLSDAKTLSDGGKWNSIVLRQRNISTPKIENELPITASVINSLPGVGELAFASRLSPKGEIAPHCGAWNLRLNIHLGIEIPNESGISVGGVPRKWREGKCLVFDDSFEHFVWNYGDKDRIVLVVNVWHPDLPDSEIPTLARIASEIAKSET